MVYQYSRCLLNINTKYRGNKSVLLQTVSEQQCNTVTEEVCSQQQSQSCTTVPEVEKMTITMMETHLHYVTAGGVSGGAGGGVQHRQRSPLREGRGRELRAGAGDTYLHISTLSTSIYTIYKYLHISRLRRRCASRRR